MAGSGSSSRVDRNVGSSKRRLLRFELLDQRRVLASLTGQVFHDADQSLRKDDAEVGLANRVVYLDLNNNQVVDRNEPLRFTDETGRFEFKDLAAGEYVVRLFNGTESQTQNFPFRPVVAGEEVLIVDGFSTGDSTLSGLAGNGLTGFTAAGRLLSELDLETNQVSALQVDSQIHGIASLGNGQVLAWTEHGTAGEIMESTPVAVIVNVGLNKVTPLELSLPASTPRISDLAVAGNERGLFVPHFEGDSPVPLYSFVLDTENETWTTKQLNLNVDNDAQVLGGASGPLVLVAQPIAGGTQVALVSTITESVVSSHSISVEGGLHFLAFDDNASLAIAKSEDGTVYVIDTANNFATLRTIADWSGELAFDGKRELLFGVDATGLLRIFDLVEGENIATLPLGQAYAATAALALADGGDRLLIRRASGVTQVRIDQIDAHRVLIEEADPNAPISAEPQDILFGMVLNGDNLAPSFTSTPTYEMLEDTSLFSPAPGVMLSLSNPELDNHIAIQVSDAQYGIARLNPNGSLTYQPGTDFFGTDTFNITVTDGRDKIENIPVVITVLPVDDGPKGFNVEIGPIPELTNGPAVLGTIQFEEVDGDHYVITIDDPRFGVEDNQIVLVEGAELDFETEPTIEITITLTNPDNPEDTEVYTTPLTIEDSDDPPTNILPATAEVEENVPGAEIATLTLVDQDSHEGYVLSVSDPRFVIVDRVLKLTEFVALDHEVEPTLTLTITAATLEGEQLLSRELVITVLNAADPITDITLSKRTLPELSSGYRVGAVGVVHQASNQQYQFGVDDSRFEIVDATLKLRDGVFVLRSDQAEIQLTISATPQSEGGTFSKQFILSVTSNESPWHNYNEPADVDNDGHVEALDALIIINVLNNSGPYVLDDVIPYENGPPRFVDVNGDGEVTPIDALIIINELNRGGGGAAEPEGPGSEDTTEEDQDEPKAIPVADFPVVAPLDDDEDE